MQQDMTLFLLKRKYLLSSLILLGKFSENMQNPSEAIQALKLQHIYKITK